MKKVAIINYGMGNVLSVQKALNALNVPSVISDNAEEINDCTHIILPGVGSFKKAMSNLREKNLVDILHREVREKGKPFMGICLGMQLLAKRGYEDGETEGLGFIEGQVEVIPDHGLPATHIGWNNITITNDAFFRNINDNNFYFVHSYYFNVSSPSDVAATVEYGSKLVAAVQKGNVFGTQFHPEKSQEEGLKVLQSFLQGHA